MSGHDAKAKRDWIVLRMTALVGIPLVIWFINSVIFLTGADHAQFTLWVSKPLNAGLMIVMIVTIFWHAALGAHEIIEDYVHNEKIKTLSLRLKSIAFLILAGICVVSILKVAIL